MVLADGCFDPLHVGHIAYFRQAKEKSFAGCPLVVNIAPDAAILAKGRRPFQTQIERAELVLALGIVDRVTCYDLAEAILTLKPTYLAKGDDWVGRLPDAVRDACQRVGTEIIFTNTTFRPSSERLVS